MLSNCQLPFLQKVVICYNKKEGLKGRPPSFPITLCPFSVILLELCRSNILLLSFRISFQ